MSTRVQAYINPEDEQYKKQSAVLIACHNAKISLPPETMSYFNAKDYSSEDYLSLLEEKLEISIPKTEYNNEYSSGYEVYIKHLPQGVYKIRFINSW